MSWYSGEAAACTLYCIDKCSSGSYSVRSSLLARTYVRIYRCCAIHYTVQILAFKGQLEAGEYAYAKGVTAAAAQHGACADNFKQLWPLLFKLGER
jgi:hypothetical protein